jgi:lipopolysaccharide export system permease protein
MRFRLGLRYVLGEMIPPFFLGVIVFVFILLMFQVLRLTEFVLIHGVKLSVMIEMMTYLSTSFLPVLFPMSLLFTVILTYGRLSADSEIVAFKASGLNMWHILTPALILSILVAILSLQMAFYIAPWGNRQFEVLFTKVGSSKPTASIREGIFSEGFFNMVVYANKVDSKRNILSQVFIFDERNAATPTTVIAKEGRLLFDAKNPGHNAALRLEDGSIHRTSEGRHTKIDFSSYDIYLSDPVAENFRDKSPPSLSLEELKQKLMDPKLEPQQHRIFRTEFHRRFAISTACLLFALIGVGLGTSTNRRAARSGGMVLSLILIVLYWILYIVGENLAKSGALSPWFGMWMANIIFALAAVFTLKRAWN